jgi:NMD protein affecting ribosome stability and mRNA decay
MSASKGLIRAGSRRSTASGKTVQAERRGRLREPSVCERCGALFRRRVWRRNESTTHALLARTRWTVCPACKPAQEATYIGRVRIPGPTTDALEALIRRRVRNVAKWASAAQPERRLVSMERDGDVLEILTTSQKLAHRIVHELKKILGGHATYEWSDDGSLFATWEPSRTGERRKR